MSYENIKNVPVELRRILLDFTVSCLLEKPDDLIEHGYLYFRKLRECRQQDKVGKVTSADQEAGFSKTSDTSVFSSFTRQSSGADMKFLAMRRMSVKGERYNPEEDKDSLDTYPVHPKSDEERTRLVEDFKAVLLFRSIDREDVETLMNALVGREVTSGEIIIQQGFEEADNFYIIDSGEFEALVEKEDGESKVMKTYVNSGSFGEIALLYNVPRAATIRAMTDGKLWVLDRITFRRIVLRSAFLKRQRYQALIESLDFLKSLNAYEKLDLVDSLMPKYYDDGELIIRQGGPADGMYFVESGGVRCVVNHPEQGRVNVRDLVPGEFFGELALMTNTKRALSAYAIGPTKLAFLDRDAFERLLGPCEDVMKRQVEVYEQDMLDAVGSTTSVYYRGSFFSGEDNEGDD